MRKLGMYFWPYKEFTYRVLISIESNHKMPALSVGYTEIAVLGG